MRKKTLLYLFFIISSLSFSSASGLPIESNLDKGLSLAQLIGRYMFGGGIIAFFVMQYTGARENALKYGGLTIVGGAIVSNIDSILDFVGMTGGAII